MSAQRAEQALSFGRYVFFMMSAILLMVVTSAWDANAQQVETGMPGGYGSAICTASTLPEIRGETYSIVLGPSLECNYGICHPIAVVIHGVSFSECYYEYYPYLNPPELYVECGEHLARFQVNIKTVQIPLP